jgi:hypothetical protein
VGTEIAGVGVAASDEAGDGGSTVVAEASLGEDATPSERVGRDDDGAGVVDFPPLEIAAEEDRAGAGAGAGGVAAQPPIERANPMMIEALSMAFISMQ